MSDTRIVVRFEAAHPGFTLAKDYEVIVVEGGKLLLVDDGARFRWVDTSLPVASVIERGGQRLFDLDTHRFRQRLESMIGKRVVLTTWEHLGFDADEVTEGKLFLYRGSVEAYDGQTLFLRREGPEGEGRFGIAPAVIASLDEDAAGPAAP